MFYLRIGELDDKCVVEIDKDKEYVLSSSFTVNNYYKVIDGVDASHFVPYNCCLCGVSELFSIHAIFKTFVDSFVPNVVDGDPGILNSLILVSPEIGINCVILVFDRYTYLVYLIRGRYFISKVSSIGTPCLFFGNGVTVVNRIINFLLERLNNYKGNGIRSFEVSKDVADCNSLMGIMFEWNTVLSEEKHLSSYYKCTIFSNFNNLCAYKRGYLVNIGALYFVTSDPWGSDFKFWRDLFKDINTTDKDSDYFCEDSDDDK